MAYRDEADVWRDFHSGAEFRRQSGAAAVGFLIPPAQKLRADAGVSTACAGDGSVFVEFPCIFTVAWQLPPFAVEWRMLPNATFRALNVKPNQTVRE
jgi:hypothetical protein